MMSHLYLFYSKTRTKQKSNEKIKTQQLSFNSYLALMEKSIWALLKNTTSRHLFSVPLVHFHMNSLSLIFIHLFMPLKLNIEYPSQVSLCTRKVRQLDYTSYNQSVHFFFHICSPFLQELYFARNSRMDEQTFGKEQWNTVCMQHLRKEMISSTLKK